MSLSGSISRVELKDNAGFHTLWDAEGSHSYKTPVGVGWELRVWFTATSTKGQWAVAVTAVSNGIKKGVSNRLWSATTINDCLDLDMGKFPDKKQRISITLWVTDYYTTQLPPVGNW